MNEFFNFKIPDYNLRYGLDWGNFKSIVGDNVDYVFKKIFECYHLKDLNKMPLSIIERFLKQYKIDFYPTDTTETKITKLRFYFQSQKRKTLQDFYLDLIENIVGVRGIIYSGEEISGAFEWDTSAWYDDEAIDPDSITWGSESSKFLIFINVKTIDEELINQILSVLRAENILPAFYKIFLIDDAKTIIAEV